MAGSVSRATAGHHASARVLNLLRRSSKNTAPKSRSIPRNKQGNPCSPGPDIATSVVGMADAER